MNLKTTRLHILKGAQNLKPIAKTGVSLHCHTEHSKEMLDFVPHYADKLPIINFFWRREQENFRKREQKEIDFSTAYWSPPLTARGVYDIETKQINDFDLRSIVSITDHDCIDSGLEINQTTANSIAPISLEWTVPFDFGFFHVGVHNLPKDRAKELTEILLEYTFNEKIHSPAKLDETFAMLNELPDVLVILNHPIWDIELVGKEKHATLLNNFIKKHGRWIHALEINGFRSWSENKQVIELAEALGIPIATGGDRHGCKPNTVINLTNAETFEEFVREIRVEKHSEVALMPEYEQPLHSRQLQSFAEILHHYPAFRAGRQKWFERVYFDIGDGKGLRPLSGYGWKKGGPLWLQAAVWTLGFLGSPAMRPIFRIARKKYDRIPSDVEMADFSIPDGDDITRNLSSEPIS